MVTAIPPRTTTGFVKLTIGSFVVALPTTALLGVERADHVLPATEPGVAGRLVHRFGEFRVCHLCDVIGGAGSVAGRSGQVALIQRDEERIGLWVDRVAQLPRGSMPRTETTPAALDAGCFSGVILLDGGPIPVLDVVRILGEPLPSNTPLLAPPVTRRRTNRPAVGNTRILAVAPFEYPDVGGRTVAFGLSSGAVAEVVDAPPSKPVLGAPPYVVGMIRWREQALTLIDPAVWCGMDRPTAKSNRVVVMRVGTGERLAVAAGTGVKVLSTVTPHTTARLQLPLNPDRIVGVYEFPDLTLVIPRFNVAE